MSVHEKLHVNVKEALASSKKVACNARISQGHPRARIVCERARVTKTKMLFCTKHYFHQHQKNVRFAIYALVHKRK